MTTLFQFKRAANRRARWVAEILTATPASLSGIVGNASSALVITNQYSTNVTSGCTFATSDGTLATVSSLGVVTYVAVGTPTITVTHVATGATCTVGVTVAAPGSYAWNTVGPRSEALFSDWPTNAYATVGAFQAAGGSTKFSYDATNTIDGKDALLHLVSAASPSYPSRDTATWAAAADQTVHFRTNFARPAQASGYYDSAQPINQIGSGTVQYSTQVALLAVGFNSSSYLDPQWAYSTGGGNRATLGGIIINQVMGGNSGVCYTLNASLFDTSKNPLSTTVLGQRLHFIGDDWYDPACIADFFIRTYQSGVNNSTLNIQVYAGKEGSAPSLVGTASITLLNTSTAFPLPQHARWDMGHNPDGFSSYGTDWNTRYGFVQVIDNTAYPNLALDFTTTTTLVPNGLGRYGQYGAPAIIPLDYIANTTALIAQQDAHCSLRTDPSNTPATCLILAADANHESHQSAQMSQAQYSYAASTGVQLDGDHTRIRFTPEFWSGETLYFSDGWTNYGAGSPLTGTTLTQAVTASGSPQAVTVANASKFNGYPAGGSCGLETANYEALYISAANTGAGTWTAVFSNNHASGEDIRQAAGAGYKLIACETNIDTIQARLEFVGTAYQTYILSSNSGALDTTQPAYATNLVGTINSELLASNVYATSGSAADVLTIPVGNSQLETPNGTRYGQQKPLRMYCHGIIWVDDYGKTRVRMEQYWVSAAGVAQMYNMAECAVTSTALSGVTYPSWANIHFGENFNETLLAAQTLDRYGVPLPGSLLGGGFSAGQVVINPQDPAIGADPFDIMALFGVSTIAAPTLGTTKGATSSSLTIPVTSPSSGIAPTKLLVDRKIAGVWTADSSPITWTVGQGGEQDVVISGLTTGTNYTGLLRVRLISAFGPGVSVAIASGTTT